ncbi:hypothetical protein [Vibrio scophthalmi]|uniref:Uncharacterized protein n=1 Tax=Vibrio scophthalmi TaxID=45658 RepID=A0A1C7F8J8_9VIBR|nr:hypothetical protein [Vibrio scophthalmi]ANU36262.1 hypothetical protein VSVS05_01135 [Vibrio scophthalmi]
MSKAILTEIRDSLAEIKAFAMSPAIVAEFTPEQEDQLKRHLKKASLNSGAMQNLVLSESVRPAIKSRDVFDIVSAINILSMSNVDVLHVHVRFSAHVNCFSVHVNPLNSSYTSGIRDDELLNESVWLYEGDSLQRLLAIEGQVTELIIEAREEAEAKAEVETC